MCKENQEFCVWHMHRFEAIDEDEEGNLIKTENIACAPLAAVGTNLRAKKLHKNMGRICDSKDFEYFKPLYFERCKKCGLPIKLIEVDFFMSSNSGKT